jgi:hypothetical protein
LVDHGDKVSGTSEFADCSYALRFCHSGQVFVTNHALSGVLIGRALERRPAAAFVVGIGSHLAVDMIPHWGCDKEADGYPERFLRVAKRDGLLGLAAMAACTLAVDRRARPAVLAAMAGAVLLDLDKPCGHFFGFNPFPGAVRRIHSWAQNESESGMANEFTFGVAFAVVDAAAAALSRSSRTG